MNTAQVIANDQSVQVPARFTPATIVAVLNECIPMFAAAHGVDCDIIREIAGLVEREGREVMLWNLVRRALENGHSHWYVFDLLLATAINASRHRPPVRVMLARWRIEGLIEFVRDGAAFAELRSEDIDVIDEELQSMPDGFDEPEDAREVEMWAAVAFAAFYLRRDDLHNPGGEKVEQLSLATCDAMVAIHAVAPEHADELLGGLEFLATTESRRAA